MAAGVSSRQFGNAVCKQRVTFATPARGIDVPSGGCQPGLPERGRRWPGILGRWVVDQRGVDAQVRTIQQLDGAGQVSPRQPAVDARRAPPTGRTCERHVRYVLSGRYGANDRTTSVTGGERSSPHVGIRSGRLPKPAPQGRRAHALFGAESRAVDMETSDSHGQPAGHSWRSTGVDPRSAGRPFRIRHPGRRGYDARSREDRRATIRMELPGGLSRAPGLALLAAR